MEADVKSEPTNRIRDTVYVVGAGFSAGLGYPLTKSLLIDAWDRVPKESRDQPAEDHRVLPPKLHPETNDQLSRHRTVANGNGG